MNRKILVTLAIGFLVGYGASSFNKRTDDNKLDFTAEASMMVFNQDGNPRESVKLIPVCLIQDGKKSQALNYYDSLGKPDREGSEFVSIKMAGGRVQMTAWMDPSSRVKDVLSELAKSGKMPAAIPGDK